MASIGYRMDLNTGHFTVERQFALEGLTPEKDAVPSRERPGHRILPSRVIITYRYRQGEWMTDHIMVIYHVVKKDGTLGKMTTRREYYGWSNAYDVDAPDWLKEIATETIPNITITGD